MHLLNFLFFAFSALFYATATCEMLLEKRFTMPDLAPKSTVELKTTGTPTSMTTTRALYGQTTVTLSTGTAVPTGELQYQSLDRMTFV